MSPTVFTAIVEQGLKVFTGIYKRIFRSLKKEYEKLYRLNRIYLPMEMSYYPKSGAAKMVRKDDYELGNGVEPYADPTMVVDAQRMARAQVLAEFKDDPSMNGMEIRKRILEAGNIEAPEKILSGQPAPNPDLILATGKLELERMVAKAQSFKFLAEAIKAMAEADEKSAGPFMAYATKQLELLQQNGSQDQNGNPGASAPGNPGNQPAGDAVAPPPSGDAGNPALSAGLA
jgi:chaperonin GroES